MPQASGCGTSGRLGPSRVGSPSISAEPVGSFDKRSATICCSTRPRQDKRQTAAAKATDSAAATSPAMAIATRYRSRHRRRSFFMRFPSVLRPREAPTARRRCQGRMLHRRGLNQFSGSHRLLVNLDVQARLPWRWVAGEFTYTRLYTSWSVFPARSSSFQTRTPRSDTECGGGPAAERRRGSPLVIQHRGEAVEGLISLVHLICLIGLIPRGTTRLVDHVSKELHIPGMVPLPSEDGLVSLRRKRKPIGLLCVPCVLNVERCVQLEIPTAHFVRPEEQGVIHSAAKTRSAKNVSIALAGPGGPAL